MSPEQCMAALDGLRPLENCITEDEAVALTIVREALTSIARGETLDPPAPGEPLKMRLLRRLEVRFFHHLAPREQKTPNLFQLPPLTPPAEQ